MSDSRGARWVAALMLALVLGGCRQAGPPPAVMPTELLPSATPTSPPPATQEPTPGEPPTATPPLPTAVAIPVAHLQAGLPLTVEWISMVNAAEGWGIALLPEGMRRLLRTADGGEHWADVTPPEAEEAAGSERRSALATIADARRAWIVYGGVFDMDRGAVGTVVWHTADAGQTWLPSTVIHAPEGSGWFEPLSIGFLEDGFGWLMAAIDAGMMKQYVALYATMDGGVTWTRVLDPYGVQPVQSCPKTGLAFVDASHGWMTRDCGGLIDQVTVITTVDGGVNWTEVPLPPPVDLPGGYNFANLCTPHSIRLETPLAGSLGVSCRAYLETPGPGGETMREGPHALYRTEDGGATWAVRSYPGGQLLWLDDLRGWALGRNINWTEDGGASWSLVHQVSWDGQFSFVDARAGWAVANNADEIALVRTRDGGIHWSIIKPVVGP